MNNAKGVGLLIKMEVPEAQVGGTVKEPEEMVLLEGPFTVVNDSEGDASAGMVKSGAEGATGFVIDGNETARCGIGRRPLDHRRVKGGMIAEGLELDPRRAPLGGGA